MGAASSAYGATLDLAHRLRSAAAQQGQLQQQQAQKQFSDELELRKAGYTPYMVTTGQDPSGLKRRAPQAADPNGVITDPYGRKWVAPAAKPEATPQQGYAGLQTALERGGRAISPEGNVAQHTDTPRYRADGQGNQTDTGRFGIFGAVEDQGRVATPPGGKQSYYMPTAGETLSEKLRTENANKPEATPTINTKDFSTPVSIDHKSGKVTALQLPDGVTLNGKPDRYMFSYHTDDSGTVHVLRGNPQTGEVEEVKSVKGAGAKRKDPDAPSPPKPPSAAQLRMITQKKADRLNEAEIAFKKDTSLTAGSPEMQQDALNNLNKAKQEAQNTYEEELANLMGHDVAHFNYGAQPPQPGAGGATPRTGGRGGAVQDPLGILK